MRTIAEPGRVLVPVMAGIGNALMARPLVAELAARFEVHVVSRNAAMLDTLAGLPLAGRGLVSLSPRRLHEAASTMRGFRADTVVLPFPANRWQYRALARAALPRNVVTHRYPVGRLRALGLLDGAGQVPAEAGLHDVAQNLNLLRRFGVTPPTPTPAPRLDVEPDVAALRRLGLSRPVVIHAGCANTVLAAAKRWPPAKFAAVVDGLRGAGGGGCEVLLVEGPDERGVAAKINGLLGEPAAALPLTGTLLESAAVLAACRLYVGTDSGLAHLAAAAGTPAVTIFTVADPDRVCPFGHRDKVIAPPAGFGGTFPDAPYPMRATRPKARYEPPLAIDAIEPGAVLERALAALAEA